MAVTKTFAGNTYQIPQNREPKATWGTQLSNFLIALADNAIPKTGGSYPLTAELNFGSSYGVLAPYIKSATANIASAGTVRLAQSDAIKWRNNANGADLALDVSSDVLRFAGNAIHTAGGGTIVNADVNASAAIAYSKLNLAGSIVNADVNASAAIAYSKLAALSASKALVSDASGFVSASAVTSTELGYVSGVTSALQTQLNAKQASSSLLSGIAAVGSDGLLYKNGVGAGVRTITAGSSKISITNGDGLSGNPTIDVNQANLSLGSIGGQVNLGSQATGTLPITNGGSGQTTANAALNAFLPSQTANGGKVLSTDGSNASWADVATVDGLAPVGAIVAYHPGYYTAAANSGFTRVGPSTNNVAGVNAYLPTNWRVCDGTALNDPGSLIFNGAGRYLPDLTDDRFIKGATSAGTAGGANSVTLTTTELPSHSHTIDHNHANVTSTSNSVSHTHGIDHDHASQDSNLMSTANNHSHTMGTGGSFVGNGSGTTANVTTGGGGYILGSNTSVANLDHRHAVDLPNYVGSSGVNSASHTHDVDLPNFTGSSGSAGSGSAFSILPKYVNAFYIMRVK